MNMDPRELVQTIADKVQSKASVKTIVGDPIHAEGKTIVPIAHVSYGFGAGGGSSGNSDANQPRKEAADAGVAQGGSYGSDWDTKSGNPEDSGRASSEPRAGAGAGGGGGGGGVNVSPVGVLEITHDYTRFIRIGSRRRLAAALLLGAGAGFLAGRFMGR